MNFRLTFDGQLMAKGGGLPHKHDIRRRFHQQLKRLWEIQPSLSYWSKPGSQNGFGDKPGWKDMAHRDWLADNYKRGAYRFIPLAREFWLAIVTADILFLRSGRPGAILKSADIDGRLKTLIDALRIPTDGQEIDALGPPLEGEDPFYCLAEDDKLIGNISVTTDALLEPTSTSHGLHDTHDARLVIAVGVKSYSTDGWGNPFR